MCLWNRCIDFSGYTQLHISRDLPHPWKRTVSKAKDRTGEKHGRLTVLRRGEDYRPPNGKPAIQWICQCECGTLLTVNVNNLRQGNTRSCGCLMIESATKHGLAYHPLYGVWGAMRNRCTNPDAAGYADYGGRGVTYCKEWEDLATFVRDVGPRPSNEHSLDRIDNDRGYEPGNVKWATLEEQAANKRRRRNAPPPRPSRKVTPRPSPATGPDLFGAERPLVPRRRQKRERIYQIWASMKGRCTNPNIPQYKDWGGRGITFKREWADFLTFRREVVREIGLPPSPKHVLDRINNDGNYEPGNVRWATQKENNNNTRQNVKIEWQGETLTRAEWADRLNIPYDTFMQRVFRWPLERAMTTAYRPNGMGAAKRRSRTQPDDYDPRSDLITFEGESLSVADWARKLGMEYRTLRGRLTDHGWSIERALTTTVRKRRKGGRDA